MKLRLFPVLAALAAMPVLAQDPAAPESATNSVPAEAAEAAPASAEAPDQTALEEWTHYIRQGGKTMWFIGLGCALERLLCLRRSRIVPDGLSADVVRLWNDGAFDEIGYRCAKSRSALARVVETMLEYKGSKDVLEVKAFAEDKAGRELRLEGRKAAMLATVATLAPLLGLFGTVLGLLEAFGTVAAMGEMGDASVLADSIGKALVTTVAGLAVAMPALFVHQIVRNRLSLYSVILEDEIAGLVQRTVGAKR